MSHRRSKKSRRADAQGDAGQRVIAAGAEKAPIASIVDRHVLYQHAVQAVDAEIDFVDDTYRDLRGRRARVLREDFCGTANTSCEWVRRRASNRAIGVDIDPDVLAWGREQNIKKLKPAVRSRVQIVQADVLHAKTPRADIALAMNFSYWMFKSRDGLRRYFEAAHRSLAPGGMFMMDCYGGSDAHKEMREKREIKAKGAWGDSFTYVWDQADFDPVSSHLVCHIHFHFKDGSKLRRAFTYDWRLWTLPEIREILAEAGFARSTVYWEGWDDEAEEGDGDFQPVEQGEADLAWICYVVAEK
ncbi:MAG: methyltransferase domain-containing protein [Phycisphaerales bacterium]